MARPKLKPTVTIGGAPAGYQPVTLQPTVTIGGAPAGYRETFAPAPTPAATTPTRATPGQFRQAEEASNVGAPVYTPSAVGETSEFVEETPSGKKKFRATDGTVFEDEDTYNAYQTMLNEKESALDIKKRESQSAYDLLYAQFAQYGMGSLVEPLKQYIQQGLSRSEFTLRLRETKAYEKRFAANAKRIASGLTALDEAAYIGLEDQYQNIMREYGLPASYYARGELGIQEGFEKLLANDVSPTELEDRVMTAQSRVINANPEVLKTLKQFYPDITNGDILAYTLDPTKGLSEIKRKITASEIGGAALAAGLDLGKTPEQIAASEARARMLAGYGVSKEQAMTGFQTVAEIAPRGSQLAEFYNRPTYGQMEAEQEVFNLEGAVAARNKRKQLTELERASFSGSAGAASQGAIGRERAMGQGQI
jgi:hypothetical protein